MAAPKLSQLIKTSVRKLSNIEIICSLGCGNVIKDYVHVTVMPPGVQILSAEPTEVQDNGQLQPALDMRICPSCWAIYVYDQTETYREVMEKVNKGG